MDKIKSLLSSNQGHDENTAQEQRGTTGTHGLSGEGSHLGAGHTGTSSVVGNNPTGLGSGIAGPHDSNLANKADPFVDSDRSKQTGHSGHGNTSNTSSGFGSSTTTTAGPHDSNLANKADPRVDSDRSKQAGHTGLGNSSNTASGYGSTTAGPHDSNLANKADPRVDSDRSKQTGHSGLGNTSNTTSGYGSNTTAGPHDSNLANKADPRVDSDRSQQTGQSGFGNTSNTASGYGSTTAGPHDSNLANKADPRVDSDRSKQTGHSGLGNTSNTASGYGSGTTTAGPHDSNLANKADPRVDSDRSKQTGHSGFGNTSSDHHTGRDAAALGTAGAVGEGVHHHRENERDNLGSSSHATSTNPSGLTTYHTGSTGPHSTETANRLDPNVNTQDSTHGGTHRTHDESTDKHHLGRDAAVAGAGAGVVGHEHNKHENNKHEHDKGTGIGSKDSNLHSNQYDNTGAGHHIGKESAAGAGAAGLAHEHNKGDLPGPAPNTAGPHKQDWLNKLDPRVNANPDKSSTGHGPFKVDAAESQQSTHKPNDSSTGYTANPAHHGVSKTEQQNSSYGGTNTTGLGSTKDHDTSKLDSEHHKDHHHGRDAAVAGGVGGTAYEAEKHHKHDKDHTTSDRKHEETHDHKDNKGGLLSFLHRDKNKTYTPEEEAEFSRQEREHNALHTSKPLPSAPGNHGIGTGEGTQNALAGEHDTKDRHLGRDAAAVGGAGAVGEHEHNKHTSAAHEQTAGSDIGDKLHGVDRNRGVPGTSGFPGTEGFGSGPNHGTGFANTTGSSGVGNTGNTTTTGHHGSGLTGSGIGGDNEYRKTDTTTGAYGSQQQGVTHGDGLTGSHAGDERNRLHKDAPASHTQGTGQTHGTGIGDNTGVANSHNVNSGTNY